MAYLMAERGRVLNQGKQLSALLVTLFATSRVFTPLGAVNHLECRIRLGRSNAIIDFFGF